LTLLTSNLGKINPMDVSIRNPTRIYMEQLIISFRVLGRLSCELVRAVGLVAAGDMGIGKTTKAAAVPMASA
jgi:NaMN:DMB phosphoribosyltransferase